MLSYLIRLSQSSANDSATSQIYTLSLHDALPISTVTRAATPSTSGGWRCPTRAKSPWSSTGARPSTTTGSWPSRSEEHTSELQSHSELVCRLLLEKKNESEWVQYTTAGLRLGSGE